MGRGIGSRQARHRREQEARRLAETIEATGWYTEQEEENAHITIPSATGYPGIRIKHFRSGRVKISANQETPTGIEFHSPNSRESLKGAKTVVEKIKQLRERESS